MPTPNELTKKRIAETEKAAAASAKVVRAAQQAAYGILWDWISTTIEVEEGRIKYTAANLGRVQTVFVLFNRFQKKYSDTMLGDVLKWAGNLFGLNDEYFQTFETQSKVESIRDTARRLTLQRWGYNVGTKELIPGGYFEALFNSASVAQRTAGLVNQAIAQNMSLKDFQKSFRALFVGTPGNGMLERHWKTNSFDLYQRIDRTANLVYADKLGLNYAVYSGTLEKDSRPFCIARVNKVFSRPEIKNWETLQFQGKPKIGYDPFTDCGGFNCRHHLSWVSDELAQKLRPELAEK